MVTLPATMACGARSELRGGSAVDANRGDRVDIGEGIGDGVSDIGEPSVDAVNLDATETADAVDATPILTCPDVGARGVPPLVYAGCAGPDQLPCQPWAQMVAPPGATAHSGCDGRRCRRGRRVISPDGTPIYVCGLSPECSDNQDCVSFYPTAPPICVCIPPQ